MREGNRKGASADSAPPDRLGGWTLLGAVLGLGMLAGGALWAATTKIDGAVIASAQVVVDSNRKTVQHLEGGIVRDILVKEGDLVEADDVLLRLDTTEDRSALVALEDRLIDLAARRARLFAELQGEKTIAWPQTVEARVQQARTLAVIASQEQLFRSRRIAQQANKRLLAKRAAALQARIDGLVQQALSLRKELALSSEENELLSSLRDSKLIPLPRLLEVRRNIARLESRLAEVASERLSLKAQIEELSSQHEQDSARFREQAAAELIDVQAEITELEEQRAALSDRLRRREVRAPRAGHVFNLAVHTRGAVVASGDPLLQIVPLHDDLVLQARIPPREIERVVSGLAATVRMTAFNRDTTPELVGTVETVSADANYDQETGSAFYAASVRLSADQLSLLEGRALTPGMPAEVLIRSGERVVVSYLARPLEDSFTRAFRDD